MTTIKECPILFSTAMVQAILAGNKTMTRRVIKASGISKLAETGRVQTLEQWGIKCPYGQVGDRLWVRETIKRKKYGGLWWLKDTFKSAEYKCEYVAGGIPNYYMVGGEQKANFKEKVVPSIHMFRHECRLVLEITGIRVERLQDISEADAKAEGVEDYEDGYFKWYGPLPEGLAACSANSALDSFYSLWQSINGHDSWAANPWVWVVEFRRVEA